MGGKTFFEVMEAIEIIEDDIKTEMITSYSHLSLLIGPIRLVPLERKGENLYLI